MIRGNFKIGSERAWAHTIQEMRAETLGGKGMVLYFHTDRPDKRVKVSLKPNEVMDLLNDMLGSMPLIGMVQDDPDHPLIKMARTVVGAADDARKMKEERADGRR